MKKQEGFTELQTVLVLIVVALLTIIIFASTINWLLDHFRYGQH